MIIAGIDVGNSSTEIVLVRLGRAGIEVIAASRAMTRGVKGSLESLQAAARLVHRTATTHQVTITAAVVAPLQPVETSVHGARRPPAATAPLIHIAPPATTAAGDASASGRPIAITELAGRDVESFSGGPVVAVVDGATPYHDAARAVNLARRAGVPVTAVVVERDEAVLIANRLEHPLPVVDQVPAALVAAADLIAVEARPQGRPLRHVTDPYWVSRTFDLPVSAVTARTLTEELRDASYAVLVRLPDGLQATGWDQPTTVEGHVRWRDGSTSALLDSVARLREAPPGVATAISFEGGWTDADDVFAVDLAEIARDAHVRQGSLDRSYTAVSVLQKPQPTMVDAVTVLSESLNVPVLAAVSESDVGRSGALTTPGCPPDAVVVDLGGGTIDVSDRDRRVILAGAGELLTQVTARALGIPAGTAEYVKRGPAVLANGPHVLVDEKGARNFSDSPLPGDAVGALCVPGPVGMLAFNRTLGLAEWRAWRRVAKTEIIGRNVERGLAALGGNRPSSLLVVGGAAADDEIVAVIAGRLPPGSVVGRGDVAGSLGHRYAVAYGLAQHGVRLL